MRRTIKLLALLIALLATGGVVAGTGAVLYHNAVTGHAYPADLGSAPTTTGYVLTIKTLSPLDAYWAPGAQVGSGTTGYIPEWTPDGSHLGNSTLWESGSVLYRQFTAGQSLQLQCFSSSSAVTSLVFKRSHSSTLGALATTLDGDFLGGLQFVGVNTTPGTAYGAQIVAAQYGTAGADVPTKLSLYTYSSNSANLNQLVLNPDNSVSMSGPVSAANLPYCKDGQIIQAGISSGTGTNTATVTSRSCQDPPSSGPPLSNSGPSSACIGGSCASFGSSNAAMRADAVISIPLPSCKPGQVMRYGTMTATGTGTATATTTTLTCQNN